MTKHEPHGERLARLEAQAQAWGALDGKVDGLIASTARIETAVDSIQRHLAVQEGRVAKGETAIAELAKQAAAGQIAQDGRDQSFRSLAARVVSLEDSRGRSRDKWAEERGAKRAAATHWQTWALVLSVFAALAGAWFAGVQARAAMRTLEQMQTARPAG